MARERTFSELLTEAKQFADLEGSDFIDDEQWRRLINQGLQELWDLIIESEGHEFVVDTYTLSTTSGTKTYDLMAGEPQEIPVDIYILLGVDAHVAGDGVPLYSATFWDRHWGDDTIEQHHYYDLPRYRLQGKQESDKDYTPQIRFTSDPGSRDYTIWYIPYPPYYADDGSNDSDTVDGFNGWEKYATLTAAIMALTFEESDPGPLLAEKNRLHARIVSMCQKRHAAFPEVVTDITRRHIDE